MPDASATLSAEVSLALAPAVGETFTRAELSADVRLRAGVASRGTDRRVVVVDNQGGVIAELEQADVGDLEETLNQWETTSITLPINDPKIAKLTDKKLREVQVWIGDRLELWGPVTRPAITDAGLSFPVNGALWHLSRRFVGSASTINRLLNSDFGADFAHWRQLQSANFLDFMPIGYGAVGIVTSPARKGARSIKITTVYDPSHPGYGQVSLSQEVAVAAGPAGLRATLTVWAYVPEADFRSYGPEKRRGVVIYRMPSDYRTDNFFTRTGGVNSWGGARAYYTDFLEYGIGIIGETTPFDQWVKLTASVDVPPNATEIVGVSLQGVEGINYFSKPRLSFSDGLEEVNVDQAEIVEALVAHAQDPAFDKSDVNIGTAFNPTGVVRTLVAPYAEHASIWGLIAGYTKLADGIDLSTRYTAHRRELIVHHPMRGSRRPELALQSGKNVATFKVVPDGEAASTSVIALGAGNADTREQGFYFDASDYADEVTLEEVLTAPPEIEDDDLDGFARAEWDSVVDPEIVEVTTYPGTDLVFRLELGDTLPVRLESDDVLITGDWRVVKRVRTPDDTLNLTLNKVG